MADYIDREEEIKSWEKAKEIAIDERYPVDEIISSLRSAPSVDAVEVVRCKDCKFNNDGVCERIMYDDEKWGLSTQYVDDDDFCKWGEKE